MRPVILSSFFRLLAPVLALGAVSLGCSSSEGADASESAAAASSSKLSNDAKAAIDKSVAWSQARLVGKCDVEQQEIVKTLLAGLDGLKGDAEQVDLYRQTIRRSQPLTDALKDNLGFREVLGELTFDCGAITTPTMWPGGVRECAVRPASGQSVESALREAVTGGVFTSTFAFSSGTLRFSKDDKFELQSATIGTKMTVERVVLSGTYKVKGGGSLEITFTHAQPSGEAAHAVTAADLGPTLFRSPVEELTLQRFMPDNGLFWTTSVHHPNYSAGDIHCPDVAAKK